MDKSNPACYECPKSKNGLHTWRMIVVARGKSNRAICVFCSMVLTPEQTADCFRDAT